MNLHTGSADGDNGSHFTDGDIDVPSQSAGVLSIGFGPIRIGMDGEYIRDYFQNKQAHDRFDYPHVLDTGRHPHFFWYFGSGSGDTMW